MNVKPILIMLSLALVSLAAVPVTAQPPVGDGHYAYFTGKDGAALGAAIEPDDEGLYTIEVTHFRDDGSGTYSPTSPVGATLFLQRDCGTLKDGLDLVAGCQVGSEGLELASTSTDGDTAVFTFTYAELKEGGVFPPGQAEANFVPTTFLHIMSNQGGSTAHYSLQGTLLHEQGDFANADAYEDQPAFTPVRVDSPWYVVVTLFPFDDDNGYDDLALYLGPGAGTKVLVPPTDYFATSGDPGPRHGHVATIDLYGDPPGVCDAATCDDDGSHMIVTFDDSENPPELDPVTFSDGHGFVLDEWQILIPTVDNLDTYAFESDLDGDGHADSAELACRSNPTRAESDCNDYDGDEITNQDEEDAGTDPRDPDDPDDDGHTSTPDMVAETAGGAVGTVQEIVGSIGDGVDEDEDGVPDLVDNCVGVHNPAEPNPDPEAAPDPDPGNPTNLGGLVQPDMDRDGVGDACDDDIDGDGLTNDEEVNGLDAEGNSHGFGPTDPEDADSDGDGLTDGEELIGWAVSYEGEYAQETDSSDWGEQELVDVGTVISDPNTADEDDDGLDDSEEKAHGTHPDNDDTDGDGILDDDEHDEEARTDQDADDDGLYDDEEVDGELRATRASIRTGADGEFDPGTGTVVPLPDAKFPTTDPDESDTDGDGLSDGVEVLKKVTVTWEDVSTPPSRGTLSYASGDPITEEVFTNPTSDNTDGDDVDDPGERDAADGDPSPRHPLRADTDLDGLSDDATGEGADQHKWDADADNDGVIAKDDFGDPDVDDSYNDDNPNADGDLWSDFHDNCDLVANTDPSDLESGEQKDRNDNGIGDACDDPDGDGLYDREELDDDGTDTNPDLWDTDGDGFSDKEETEAGFRDGDVGEGPDEPVQIIQREVYFLGIGLENAADDTTEHGEESDPKNAEETPFSVWLAKKAPLPPPSTDQFADDPQCRDHENWGQAGCDGSIQEVNDHVSAVQTLAEALAEQVVERLERTHSQEGDPTGDPYTLYLSPTGALTGSGEPPVILSFTKDGESIIVRDGQGNQLNPCTGADCPDYLQGVIADALVAVDADGDMTPDAVDNCPDDANADQEDADGDGVGDACDTQDNGDDDGDGVENWEDQCEGFDDSHDHDSDGDPDGCDADADDADSDGIHAANDNCPSVANEDQADADDDGEGDACDDDRDGDGFSNDDETDAGSDPDDPASTPDDPNGVGVGLSEDENGNPGVWIDDDGDHTQDEGETTFVPLASDRCMVHPPGDVFRVCETESGDQIYVFVGLFGVFLPNPLP